MFGFLRFFAYFCKMEKNEFIKKSIEVHGNKYDKSHGIKLLYYLDERFNEHMQDDDIYFNDIEKLIEYIRI